MSGIIQQIFKCLCLSEYSGKSLHNAGKVLQQCNESHSSYFSYFIGDRDRYSMPEELSILHAEFTYYYYPGDIPFPRKL
jgi:hypothetical protein